MCKYDFKNFVSGVTFLTNKMATNPFSLALSKSSSVYDTGNQFFDKKSKSHNLNIYIYIYIYTHSMLKILQMIFINTMNPVTIAYHFF